MSSLLLRMCILNYPVWTCPENSHEYHFAWWFLFCGRLVSTFYDHCDHRTRFSYSPQFWLNYLWSVQLFGSLDSPVFLQLSIIVLVVILSYCHTVIQFWLNYLWSVQLFGSLDSPVFLQLSIIVLVVILKLASHVHVSTCLYLVIFFPLCPASLMHKNPQDAKQIGACVL